ncbi:MAG: hypothetical protein H6704_10025 [Myxococcales bacterium]|nr:hypothetical protein [Myxococcales bacterium]
MPPFTLTDGGAHFVSVGSWQPPVEAAPVFEGSDGAEYRIVDRAAQCRPGPDAAWETIAQVAQQTTPGGPGLLSTSRGVVFDDAFLFVSVRQVKAPDPPHGILGHEVAVRRFRCADHHGLEAPEPPERVYPLEPLEVWLRPPAPGGIDRRPAPVELAVYDTLFGSEARWCFATNQAVWCLDAEAERVAVAFEGNQAPGTALADWPAERDRLLLEVGREYITQPENADPDQFTVAALEVLPDRSAVILLMDVFHPFEVRWLLRLHPDGASTVLLGPVAELSIRDVTRGPPGGTVLHPVHPSLIGQGRELHYDAEWDAIWVGPVARWAWDGVWAMQAVGGPTGWGYRVVPLEGGGSGYLDLTNALRTVNCVDANPRCTGAGAEPVTESGGPAGDWRFQLDVTPDGTNARWTYALEFDRDAVDLDADNLTAADEAARGTSDFRADSDGDGVDDGMEGLTGTDPTTADRDWHPLPVAMFPSPLLSGLAGDFFHHYPPETPGQGVPPEPGLGAGTPWCKLEQGAFGDVVCYSAAGREVARRALDGVGGGFATVSLRGDVAAIRAQDGIYRMALDGSNAVTKWMDVERLPELFDYPTGIRPNIASSQAVSLFPIDADNLWVYPTFNPFQDATGQQNRPRYRLVHVDGAGAERVVFDSNIELCALGFGVCDTPPYISKRGPYSPHPLA